MSLLEKIRHKIYPAGAADRLSHILAEREGKVVFTNGCFDIIHRGHIDYLSKAREMGGLLVIGLNSDASVRRLKGDQRPLQDEGSRSEVLASLSFVDYVILFEEDSPLELIKTLRPHILVKGSDYALHEIVGAEEVIRNGGKVIPLDYLPGYSTTAIEERILKHRQ
jgi:rfaE bifunctional protein nucleotidyltransferase chain/domain